MRQYASTGVHDDRPYFPQSRLRGRVVIRKPLPHQTRENWIMKARPAKQDLDFETEDISVADTGPGSAGQSGDTQGLSDIEDANSESVKELLEEGQYFEASVNAGIENARPPDVAEVKTRQVPEDDVPAEYLDGDEPFL